MMSYFSDKLREHLDKIQMTPYRLAKQAGINTQFIYKITSGERRPTEEVLESFASVPELDISRIELEAWRALDDYDHDALRRAIELLEKEGKA